MGVFRTEILRRAEGKKFPCMRENTKCSGEGMGSEKNISELGIMAKENELWKEVKSALIGL